MVGLGVRADAPPVAIQPPLVDGIHLRWAFKRELGFPWSGFFLFRRPSKEGRRICLAAQLRESRPDGGQTSLTLPIGTLSSDLPLRFTDDFPLSGLAEVDLAERREWLRFAMPAGDVATSVHVRVGFRRSDSKERDCIDLRQIIRTPASNPLRLGSFVIEIDRSSRTPGLIFPALRTVEGQIMGGLRVGKEAVIHLDDPSPEVRLLLDTSAGSARATAFAGGKAISEVRTTPRGGELQELVLKAEWPIDKVILQPGRRGIALLRICRAPTAKGRSSVRVTASRGGMTVASAVVSGEPGQVIDAALAADQIDTVTFSPDDGGELPNAALVELCYASLKANRHNGWRPLPECPQPLALPVFHPDYPASGQQAEDRDASEGVALPRILYGGPADFAGEPFTDLHDALVRLVRGGPASAPMADSSRAEDLAADALPPGSQEPPTLSQMHPLDLTLLAALHPAAAQMLGLYFIDRTAQPGQRFDYLVIGDWTGTSKDPMKVLAQWLSGAAGYEGYILSHQEAGPVPPLAPPSDPRAYLLPAGGVVAPPGPGGQPIRVSGLVGLRWAIPADADGSLLPRSAVLYHLWRRQLGNGAAPASAADPGDWLTKSAPILVAQPISDPFAVPQRPADWPDMPMHRIDRVLDEGWYGYRVNGMDIFGRMSAPSQRFSWRQWAPPPDPLPWYYLLPPSDAAVHPDAVRVLDKVPPPSPVGVEASALDPADPYIVADAPYQSWRNGLPVGVRNTLVGLRVSWRWTASQIQQAPDTAEFRIYYNPGGAAPGPDARAAANWSQRVHVVPFADAAQVSGNGDRLYRVFLPVQSPTVFAAGIPLQPTLADPAVFAHVGVSAADGAPHSPDDPKWAAGGFGNRAGNEGRLGVPAKIFRVLREAPQPPVPPADSDRVFATPADYHSHSYYTYRWPPQPHLKAHVLRAMDSSVFAVDRALRPRPALSAASPGIFPDQAVDPRWDAAKRGQVAAELNALNAFAHDSPGDAAAQEAYRALSNDGLRVLAGLPGNEAAFSQVTVQPLDPASPATANKVGPDNPPDFTVDANLRCYVDTLDGRSSNRYFYRAVYVDGAQNRSALSLSGPPVWLPNVLPPRAPVLIRVTGAERRIDLAWASNRERDLVAYRVYRTANQDAALDTRSMNLVATLPVAPGDPAGRPASVEWTDDPVPGLVNHFYALTAIDEAGNESEASAIVTARAFDEALPDPPELSAVWSAAAPPAQAQVSWTSPDETRLERRVVGSLQWDLVGDWRPPGAHNETVPLDPGLSWRLRLRVRKYTGALAIGAPIPLNHL